MLIRFDTILERDRQTGGQNCYVTIGISIAVLTRDKNRTFLTFFPRHFCKRYVRPSVTFVDSIEMTHTFKIFSPSGNHTILQGVSVKKLATPPL